jgi:hypothetical protein
MDARGIFEIAQVTGQADTTPGYKVCGRENGLRACPFSGPHGAGKRRFLSFPALEIFVGTSGDHRAEGAVEPGRGLAVRFFFLAVSFRFKILGMGEVFYVYGNKGKG